MRIIPAMDIINGKCVRLRKGDYSQQTTYSDNPLEMAKRFEAHGLEYLHLVDLDGAKSKQIINYKILEAITTKTKLKVDFGGGIKSDEDAKIAFESGAQQITGGSIAVTQQETFLNWLDHYGKERIILGADAKYGKIATHGWMEQSEWDVLDFIRHYESKGIDFVICTDIEKDGMLKGPSKNLYRSIMAESKIRLIASGGISNLKDLEDLKLLGCEGAIIGKAIYEGSISLKQLEELC